MLELIKKKWFEWLISIAIVTISAVLVNSFAIKRDTAKGIQDELKSKASIEYVDKQDGNIYNYIDSQDKNIKDNLQQSIDAQTKLIESMDHKIDILIQNK